MRALGIQFDQVFTTVVGILLGYLANWLRTLLAKQKTEVRKQEEKTNAIMYAVGILLRDRLYGYHDNYTRKGYISADDLQAVEDTYNAYHALGMNGVGTKVFEEIKKLPIREEKKQ